MTNYYKVKYLFTELINKTSSARHSFDQSKYTLRDMVNGLHAKGLISEDTLFSFVTIMLTCRPEGGQDVVDQACMKKMLDHVNMRGASC